MRPFRRAGSKRRELAGEAVFLERMVAEAMPDEPEALGVLAAMLYSEARAPARRDAAGRFVPLLEQDAALCDDRMVAEADAALAQAGAMGQFGRFQCAAAIQAVHAARRITGRTNVEALDLYEAFARFSPTPAVLVAQAAARPAAQGLAAGLALLAALDPARAERFQPFWAVRARLLAQAGEAAAARAAYLRAASMAEDGAVRAWLLKEAERVS